MSERGPKNTDEFIDLDQTPTRSDRIPLGGGRRDISVTEILDEDGGVAGRISHPPTTEDEQRRGN